MPLKNSKINQAKDTGLAIILILLIFAYVKNPGWLLFSAMAVLVLTMTWPDVFRPLAKVWFGFSRILGGVVSRILLTVIFFLIVTPVGLVRRLLGVDPMRTGLWKKGGVSVLVDRDMLYTKKDIEKPY
jgi:energy-coupling factor transporter transmembrane protein EcfT